jgi:hypothetical protein
VKDVSAGKHRILNLLNSLLTMDQAKVYSTPMLEFPGLLSKRLPTPASRLEHILSVSRHKSYMHDQDSSNRWSRPRSIHSLSF